MSQVSREEVRRVADLASLDLGLEEEVSMQRDLNAILGHIAQLAELDTSAIEPMAQVGDVLGSMDVGEGNALRPDHLRASLDRRAVMAAAPETDGRFFKVPKVIER